MYVVVVVVTMITILISCHPHYPWRAQGFIESLTIIQLLRLTPWLSRMAVECLVKVKDKVIIAWRYIESKILMYKSRI